jgi:hypothetical protein
MFIITTLLFKIFLASFIVYQFVIEIILLHLATALFQNGRELYEPTYERSIFQGSLRFMLISIFVCGL